MGPLALAVAAYLLWVAPGRLRRVWGVAAARPRLPLGREGASGARALVLLACLGFGLLGFVDDVLGTPADQGFRGHLRALGQRRITTGMLKLAGGGALALVVVATARPEAGWRLGADALGVALAG